MFRRHPALVRFLGAVLLGGGLLGGLAGCTGGLGSKKLSFSQVQSLNPGVSAAWLLEEYPFGRVEKGPDGGVRTVRYDVTDPRGADRSVTFVFDANEVLVDKRYTGPIVRPLPAALP